MKHFSKKTPDWGKWANFDPKMQCDFKVFKILRIGRDQESHENGIIDFSEKSYILGK